MAKKRFLVVLTTMVFLLIFPVLIFPPARAQNPTIVVSNVSAEGLLWGDALRYEGSVAGYMCVVSISVHVVPGMRVEWDFGDGTYFQGTDFWVRKVWEEPGEYMVYVRVFYAGVDVPLTLSKRIGVYNLHILEENGFEITSELGVASSRTWRLPDGRLTIAIGRTCDDECYFQYDGNFPDGGDSAMVIINEEVTWVDTSFPYYPVAGRIRLCVGENGLDPTPEVTVKVMSPSNGLAKLHIGKFMCLVEGWGEEPPKKKRVLLPLILSTFY